ncbi:MAG: ABC transporter ATP-binding protein [Myxococcus sp.]|nr:ABC transporter ATP-binding protein [Myxococcus sp.]
MSAPAPVAPAIELSDVTKTYGSGALAFQALKGIDMRVEAGEFVMLIGPSGSGKTTLLSILGCVLSPTTGTAAIFGEALHGRRESELPRLRLEYIGFIFQGHNLMSALTAEQNVAVPLELRGYSHHAALVEAREVLTSVGLGDKFKKRPEELSGGQRQRVAVARAIAGRPPLILADEPTASLDAESGMQVTQLLKALCTERGHTVICVTHDSRIYHLADRKIFLEDGRIVPEDQAH